MSPDCDHRTVGRIGDHDTPRVYLWCHGCKRVLGTYDPQKSGTLRLASGAVA